MSRRVDKIFEALKNAQNSSIEECGDNNDSDLATVIQESEILFADVEGKYCYCCLLIHVGTNVKFF